MNITFTGMQNIGAHCKRNKYEPDDISNRIAIQLNNDGENDLDDFRKVLDEKPNSVNSDVLDLEFKSAKNRRNPDSPFTNVFINSKKLELNNENLPIFRKINNLLKRISKGEEEMPVSEKYLETDGYDMFYSELYTHANYRRVAMVKDIHSSEKVKAGADKIFNNITKMVTDYYTSDPKTIFSGVKNVGGIHYSANNHVFDRVYLELNAKDKAFFSNYLEVNASGNTLNILKVDLLQRTDTGESKFFLNGNPLIIDKETIPIVQKVADLMTNISKTKEELPFPEDYLSSYSLNKISGEFFPKGYLEKLHRATSEVKEQEDVDIFVVETNKEAKSLAKMFAETINNKIETYFN